MGLLAEPNSRPETVRGFAARLQSGPERELAGGVATFLLVTVEMADGAAVKVETGVERGAVIGVEIKRVKGTIVAGGATVSVSGDFIAITCRKIVDVGDVCPCTEHAVNASTKPSQINLRIVSPC